MLLPQILGDDYARLPRALQAFHASTDGRPYVGRVTVIHGTGLAAMGCRIAGFPPPATDIEMRLSFHADADEEVWQRDFGGHKLVSRMRRLDAHHVAERFGMFEVQMRPHVASEGLKMPVTALRSFGAPVPKALIGGSGGTERVLPSGDISFDVSSRMLGLGLLIRYYGVLRPAESS